MTASLATNPTIRADAVCHWSKPAGAKTGEIVRGATPYTESSTGTWPKARPPVVGIDCSSQTAQTVATMMPDAVLRNPRRRCQTTCLLYTSDAADDLTR